MEDKNNKRTVSIELNDDVRHLTITGQDKDDQVVMHEELSDEDLDNVAGGVALGAGTACYDLD
jgi:hypothetical protein